MIKKLVLMCAGLLGIVTVAAVVIPLFLNLTAMKDPILQQLEMATGYHFHIAGEINVRVLPFAKLQMTDVQVQSPMMNKPFIKMQVLDVGLKLLPLLRGNIEITQLSLKKPELTLIKSGTNTNWQAKTGAAISAHAADNVTEQGNGAQHSIILRSIEISDGVLSYHDAQKHQQINVTGLNVTAGMSALDSPFKLKAKAMWNNKPLKIDMILESLAAVLNNNKSSLAFAFDSEALSVRADGVVDPLQYGGKIAIKSSSLSDAVAWLTGTKASGGVPVAVEAKGNADCSVAVCGLNNAEIQLNDLTLAGSVKANLAGATPNFSADLSTKILDITPYLAKKTAHISLIKSAFAASSRWSNAPIEMSFLQAINGNISLKMERFVMDKLTIDTPLLRAKIANGALSADVTNALLYKGRGMMSLNMVAGGRVDGRVSASGVEIAPLLRALSYSDRFAGTANMQLVFVSQGKSQQSLVDNLGGNGEIRLQDGSIKGVDLASMVRNVKSAFTNVDTSQKKTDFAELGGTFSIAQGIVTNNDLAMKAPLFRVSGKGTVDLPNYSINYLLKPQLVDTIKGQGAGDKSGLGVPVRISGSLDNPSYAPDLSTAVEDALKDPAKIKDTVKNAQEFLKDKNSIKDIKGLLKGF